MSSRPEDEKQLDDLVKQLDAGIKAGGGGARWTRIAMKFLATAVTSGGGGAEMFLGMAGAGLGGAADWWAEAQQDAKNEMFAACIRELAQRNQEIRETVARIVYAIPLSDDPVAERVESEVYQDLIRRAFDHWSPGQSQEKRDVIRRLLTHAAVVPQLDADLFRLYFDWVGRFNELHWRLLRTLRRRTLLTRRGIWLAMGGRVMRDDSAEADVFGCLIKDLTFAHLIHQAGVKAPTGQTFKKAYAPGPARATTKKVSSPTPFRKSPFDDEDQYELTSGGRRFVDYTWDEIGPKLGGGPAPTPPRPPRPPE